MEKTASQNHFLLLCICIHFSLFTYSLLSFFYRLGKQYSTSLLRGEKLHLPENPKLPEARDAVSSQG